METLRLDSSGPDVKRVQERLAELGFNPGKVDGEFGAGTEAAVLAFQRSSGLAADGVVGPDTAAALFQGVKRPPKVAASDILDDIDAQMVARMFPATNLGAIKANLPHVIAGRRAEELTDKPMVLMALATIRAETEGFVPISEGISRFNTSPNGPPFDLYDFRADLGNGAAGDGAKFKGRGFIQLTGRANYRTVGRAIGQPLEGQPELANDGPIAGRILASFLAKRETEIRNALIENDLRHARRLVNGGSHGLDRFTDAYQRGLDAIPG
jgi:peptidoglycan L-alanyl-D-glutamate endopeptidase CwlK